MEFLLGGRTCPGGLPDKSGKPYWNPMEKVGHIRCPKLDTLVLAGQTTDQEFRYFRNFYEKASTVFSTGNKSFQFKHLWTCFDDLLWDKDFQGI
jgi:hypothetical protein